MRISKSSANRESAQEARAHLRQIRKLAADQGSRKNKNEVPGQPFDRTLLAQSRLYRLSRRLFLERGGSFRAAVLSSARALGSPTLLNSEVEYNPVEGELLWRANDPIERRDPSRVTQLRAFTTNLFHEQNHRILWSVIPPAPSRREDLRRYLNFVESLVIVLDMAFGDELGPKGSAFFQRIGVAFDPGSKARVEIAGRRAYRNYFQAAGYATYLTLERYESSAIHEITRRLFPQDPTLAARAAARGTNLNQGFVDKTNLRWQARHGKAVVEALHSNRKSPLVLPRDPLNNIQQYVFMEEWLQAFGL
jgi:hypothetical protein